MQYEGESLNLAHNMHEYGYSKCSIWFEAFVPYPRDELFRFASLRSYRWSDARLIRCIEVSFDWVYLTLHYIIHVTELRVLVFYGILILFNDIEFDSF